MKQTILLQKKNISLVISYLVLTVSTIAASHITPSKTKILGRKIYHERCKVCHGNQGDGKTFVANVLLPPPKNFTEKNKEPLTLERMIRSVTEGRPNTAMMPWKKVLTKEEIHSVVLYIRKELMGLNE